MDQHASSANALAIDIPRAALPRLALTLDEAAECVGVSRTRIFQAVREQRLTVRKDGKATVVEITELARWIRSLPTRGKQPETVAA